MTHQRRLDRPWGNWNRRTVLKTLGAAMAVPAGSGVAAAAEAQRVVDFTTNGPENLAIDAAGNIYMTMNFSGAIRKLPAANTTDTGLDADDTDLITTLDTGGGFITGIDVDDSTLYVALPSFTTDHGIWKITQNGGVTQTLLSGLGTDRLPNGVLLDDDHDRLLVTDSFLGEILSVPLAGGPADVWVKDDLLAPDTFVGANGLTRDKHGDVFVANLDHGRIVRVPVGRDGAAGDPEPFVEDSAALHGADGLTFHNGTMLYVAVNGQDKVVRITPSGRIVTLVTADDGLSFPADIAFGTASRTRGKLFIANFAFNGDPTDPAITGDPSLMRTHP